MELLTVGSTGTTPMVSRHFPTMFTKQWWTPFTGQAGVETKSLPATTRQRRRGRDCQLYVGMPLIFAGDTWKAHTTDIHRGAFTVSSRAFRASAVQARLSVYDLGSHSSHADIRHPFDDPEPPYYLIDFLNLASTQKALGVNLNYTSSTSRSVLSGFVSTGKSRLSGQGTRRVRYLEFQHGQETN